MQMIPERNSNSSLNRFDEFSRRYQVLLQTADSAARQALPDLLRELSKLLREAVDFDFIFYGLHDPTANTLLLYIQDEPTRSLDPPLEIPIEDSLLGRAWMKQSPLVLEDLHRETGFSGTLPMFRSRGLRSIAVLPMTTMGQPLGVIAFGSDKPSDFTNGAVHFLEQITGLVGLAISNLLTRQAVAGEEEQLRALTAVSIQLSERSIRAHQASAGRKGANGNDEPRNGLPQLETLDPQPKPAAYNPNSSLRRFV